MRTLFAATVVAVVGSVAIAGPTVVPIDVVARVGGEIGGFTVTSLNAPNTNGLGGVGFTFGVANPAGGTLNGFVSYTAGLAQDILFLNNSVMTHTLTGAETSSAFGNNGEFIFSPSVNGEDAVWGQNGLIMRGGDPLAAIPGRFATFSSRPSNMQPNGVAHWVGGTSATQGGTSTGRVLWRYDGVNITPLLQTGDIVDGAAIGASGIGFSFDLSDSGAHHIHQLTVNSSTATDTLVWVNGSSVAREGSVAAGGVGGELWQAFDNVAINNSGNYIFSGDTNGAAATDEFLAYNGSIAIREGDTVDGVTLGTSVNAASINNLNQAAFIWSLAGSGEALFFASDASDLASSRLILQVGDMVDYNNDGIAEATILDFNASTTIAPGLQFSDHPWVYLEVDLMDVGGVTHEAIIRVAIPAPGAAGLLAVAGAFASRRRR